MAAEHAALRQRVMNDQVNTKLLSKSGGKRYRDMGRFVCVTWDNSCASDWNCNRNCPAGHPASVRSESYAPPMVRGNFLVGDQTACRFSRKIKSSRRPSTVTRVATATMSLEDRLDKIRSPNLENQTHVRTARIARLRANH
jgi:hypothetical protein